ncbi:uncharacterized protein LOC129338871 [Eublepharis macularius]|uniref:Uncharacterized protein LOC129338871 n=1 Tax=Eublepharis macularius TaxID=481883 RepID=A0AA97K1Y8_EUBMA|nr:uncharacterized protein LOC129338871 [Eublepharis macularius]
MAAGGGSVSARALARSVAHRLKYYIDVQRKEHSFDSSGLIRDETESSSWYVHATRLVEWEHGRPLEHDFSEVKLEASLRMYMGSAEEYHRKVQESPGKRKILEKFIKEKAQDYVPDRMNEGRAKRTQRQNNWQSTSNLHRNATPSMSAEELQRIISSASKLIVAATSEISPKVLGTTPEIISTQKRSATRSFPSLDRVWKKAPSTQSHHDEAEGIQEGNEEFRTELDQETLQKNVGKKPKATQKRKNVKCRAKPSEMSSNVSHNSYKLNRIFSTKRPKSSDSCLVNESFPSPYSPPGQNKVFRKGILKNSTSLSCTSSETLEYQNIAPNTRWKCYPPSHAGQSCKLVEIKRKKSPCTPIGVVSRTKSSRASKPLARQPILTPRNTPEVTRNNREVCCVKQMAEVKHAQSSNVSEKSREPHNFKRVSGCAILQGQAKETCAQGNWKSKLSGKSQMNWPKETEGGLDSATERNSNGHRVHFQGLQQWDHPRKAEWKHSSESCNLDNLGPKEATLPIASVDESSEILACLPNDQDKDHIITVTHGSSLGYQVCQGTQDAPIMNESMNMDTSVGNQGIKGHSGNLLNQLLSLNEVDDKAVDDPINKMQITNLILNEPWDQQVVYIPPVLPGVGETSEEGDGSSASPERSSPIFGRLENEACDEEFTISSASSSLSAESLTSTESRNMNADLKEREDVDSSTKLLVANAMQENSTIQQEMFGQHSERLSSSAEEKRTNKDGGPEDRRAATHVVYFSHLPTSF